MSENQGALFGEPLHKNQLVVLKYMPANLLVVIRFSKILSGLPEVVPGHDINVAQGTVSVGIPSQFLPPSGVGLLQERARTAIPTPQLAEHEPGGPNDPQWPSTKNGRAS